LQTVTRMCREQHLLALRRAIQNLQYALREEGDYVGSAALLTELQLGAPGGHNLATGYSDEANRAHVAGDWGRMLAAADAELETAGGGWDLQIRGLCAQIRILRDDPAGQDGPDPVEEILVAGRRSGFYRLEWTALANVALCRALQGRAAETTALLAELAGSWRPVRTIASGEWVDAASQAAAIAGRTASADLRDLLAEVTHRTPWVEAAARTAAGGVAAADGEHARAAELHLAAARLYGEMRHATDRMMALAAATRSFSRVAATDRSDADNDLAAVVRREVIAFASRNTAPGLLRLAGLEVPARP
jgi:hypothetical protein